MSRSRARVAALVACLTWTSGCGAAGSSESSGEDATLTVFAASSLTSTFGELARAFEDDHPGVTVQLNLAGSSDLAAQIAQGAPADVFASADEVTMATVAGEGLTARAPIPFATNTLQIAVPPDNPAEVRDLADLEGDVALVVCAPEVPCGATAQEVARLAGVRLHPVSEEQSVTDVLNKVTSGEADAGLVYVTDVAAAGDKVTGIDTPEARSVVNVYPIATITGSDQAVLAGQFVDLVTSQRGREVLETAGFGPPREAEE